MKPIRWLAGATLFALLAWALIFAYRKGKEERQNEVQREEPVIAPIRVAADSHGVVVRIDPAEVETLGIRLEPARAVSTAPTVQLNGVIVPDSARIAFLRAPVAGRLEAAPDAHWPELATRVSADRHRRSPAAIEHSAEWRGDTGQRPPRRDRAVRAGAACDQRSLQPGAHGVDQGAPANPPARLVVQPLVAAVARRQPGSRPSFDVDPSPGGPPSTTACRAPGPVWPVSP
jgi:hypothetical protein